MSDTEYILGSLEYVVLLAALRLQEDAYGMAVRREIERVSGQDIAISAIYTTLTRLEAKGLVRSFPGAPTAERGGRAKRYFELTSIGRKALRHTRDVFTKLSAGVKGLLQT